MEEFKLKKEEDRARVNPFKSEKPRHSHFLDKEIDIDIKINPRKAIKWSLIIVIFLAVFLMGRWSAPGIVKDLSEETSDSSGFLEFFSSFTGLFHSEEVPTAETEETPSEEKLAEEIPAEEEPVEETPAEEELAEEEEEEVEEAVITAPYHKVSFAIKNVRVDWREYWGKITHLDYTIKNSEEGTIKLDHFVMYVEGYEDIGSEKEIPLPFNSKEIKSKTSVSSTVTVPGGFNYNEKTMGSLDAVGIRLILFDADDKAMASFKKNFDLSG
jgi:hypothetical protein